MKCFMTYLFFGFNLKLFEHRSKRSKLMIRKLKFSISIIIRLEMEENHKNDEKNLRRIRIRDCTQRFL